MGQSVKRCSLWKAVIEEEARRSEMNSFASWTAHQVVWGQSFCEALVVFQPINPLHIFNRVKCVAGEVH